MTVLPHLTSANTVPQMMGKVNDIINYFDNRDAANEIVFAPNGTISANNVQMAVQQVNIQANTATNTLRTDLNANVATLDTRITQVETDALASAVALAIALG